MVSNSEICLIRVLDVTFDATTSYVVWNMSKIKIKNPFAQLLLLHLKQMSQANYLAIDLLTERGNRRPRRLTNAARMMKE